MDKKKSMIIGGGIILVIIVIVFVVSVRSSFSNDEGIPDFVIAFDKEDIRVNEIFNASLNQNFKNQNITWYFGDGNISYGQKVLHIYPYSNQYEIKVSVSSGNNKKSANASIMVRNQDEVKSYSWGSERNFIPGNTNIYTIGGKVYPGVSNPRLRFEISFQNAFGNYQILLRFINNRTGETTNVFSENYRWTFEDVDLEYTFNQDHYPNLNEIYRFQMEIHLEKGSWNRMVQSMDVTY